MKISAISKRLATVGFASALAAGALVGATATSASAAPIVTNHYTCSIPNLAGPYDVIMTTEAVGIENFPQIGAGASIPAAFLSVTNHVTIPAAAYGLLTSANVDNVTFPDIAATFGDSSVGETGTDGTGVPSAKVADMSDNGDGTRSFDANGLNAAFVVPAAGEYDILMPTAFTIDANNSDGTLIAPISCAIADGTTPGALHHITVFKNAATITAKPAVSPYHASKAAKLKITVGSSHMPTGKVVVKEGTKTLGSATLNDLGKAVVNMGKLKVGKHTLKVVYKGDGYTEAGSKKITVKVVK